MVNSTEKQTSEWEEKIDHRAGSGRIDGFYGKLIPVRDAKEILREVLQKQREEIAERNEAFWDGYWFAKRIDVKLIRGRKVNT